MVAAMIGDNIRYKLCVCQRLKVLMKIMHYVGHTNTANLLCDKSTLRPSCVLRMSRVSAGSVPPTAQGGAEQAHVLSIEGISLAAFEP